MTDIATLGLEVDSSGLKEGAKDLDKIAAAAKRAEAAATGHNKHVQEAIDRHTRMTTVLQGHSRASQAATTATMSFTRTLVSMARPGVIAGGVLTAMAASAAAAAVETAKAAAAIEIGLSGIARASGVTASEIRQLSVAAAEAGNATVGQARAFALELAGTGKVSTEIIGQSLEVSREFAKTLGQDLPAASKSLAASLADPARGVDFLAARLGSFDFQTAQRIKSLAGQNRTLEAQREIMAGVERGIVDATKSTWLWERAWNGTKDAVSSYIDRVGQAIELGLGGGTIEQKLRDAERTHAYYKAIDILIRGGELPSWARWFQSGSLDEAKRKVDELAHALRGEEADRFGTRMNEESRRIGREIQKVIEDYGKLEAIRDRLADFTDARNNPQVTVRLGTEGTAALDRALDTLAMQAAFHKTNLQIAQEDHSFFIATTTARTAAQQADIAYQQTVNKLRREGNVDAEKLAALAADKVMVAAREAEKRAIEERNFAQREMLDQMRLETQLVGKSASEAAGLRAQWDAVAEAKRRAMAAGGQITPGDVANAQTIGGQVMTEAQRLEGRQIALAGMTPAAQHAKEMENLNALYRAGALTAAEYDRAVTLAAERAGTSWTQAGDQILGAMSMVLSASDSQNKTLIKINQATALARAIVNVHEGITKALTLPFPANLAAAATVAAQGFASVNAIKSMSKSASVSSSTSVSASQTASVSLADRQVEAAKASSPQTVHVTLTGSRFSREEVRELLETINDAQGDGLRLVATEVRNT